MGVQFLGNYDMEEDRRVFIAIPLPEGVKMALGDVCERLKLAFPQGAVRWVHPDKMHLTLRFLGETAVSTLPDIMTQLDQLKPQPIHLQLTQLGCFPSKDNPRVLWAGLSGEMGQLIHLKQTIDQKLVGLGWPLETRKYNPHLTVGRVKDKREVAKIGWRNEIEQVYFRVTAVQLIQSELQRSAPIYTTLHSVTMD